MSNNLIVTVLLFRLALIFGQKLDITKQKEEIVRIHNAFRKVQRASDMNKLTWSDALSTKAQTYVDRCILQPPRGATPWAGATEHINKFHDDGNNPLLTADSLLSLAIETWYAEKFSWTRVSLDCHDSCSFTQMVWAKSTEVGCAVSKCRVLSGREEPAMNQWFVACYYNPTASKMGLPYQKGQPCELCDKKKICEDGLCAIRKTPPPPPPAPPAPPPVDMVNGILTFGTSGNNGQNINRRFGIGQAAQFQPVTTKHWQIPAPKPTMINTLSTSSNQFIQSQPVVGGIQQSVPPNGNNFVNNIVPATNVQGASVQTISNSIEQKKQEQLLQWRQFAKDKQHKWLIPKLENSGMPIIPNNRTVPYVSSIPTNQRPNSLHDLSLDSGLYPANPSVSITPARRLVQSKNNHVDVSKRNNLNPQWKSPSSNSGSIQSKSYGMGVSTNDNSNSQWKSSTLLDQSAPTSNNNRLNNGREHNNLNPQRKSSTLLDQSAPSNNNRVNGREHNNLNPQWKSSSSLRGSTQSNVNVVDASKSNNFDSQRNSPTSLGTSNQLRNGVLQNNQNTNAVGKQESRKFHPRNQQQQLGNLNNFRKTVTNQGTTDNPISTNALPRIEKLVNKFHTNQGRISNKQLPKVKKSPVNLQTYPQKALIRTSTNTNPTKNKIQAPSSAISKTNLTSSPGDLMDSTSTKKVNVNKRQSNQSSLAASVSSKHNTTSPSNKNSVKGSKKPAIARFSLKPKAVVFSAKKKFFSARKLSGGTARFQFKQKQNPLKKQLQQTTGQKRFSQPTGGQTGINGQTSFGSQSQKFQGKQNIPSQNMMQQRSQQRQEPRQQQNLQMNQQSSKNIQQHRSQQQRPLQQQNRQTNQQLSQNLHQQISQGNQQQQQQQQQSQRMNQQSSKNIQQHRSQQQGPSQQQNRQTNQQLSQNMHQQISQGNQQQQQQSQRMNQQVSQSMLTQGTKQQRHTQQFNQQVNQQSSQNMQQRRPQGIQQQQQLNQLNPQSLINSQQQKQGTQQQQLPLSQQNQQNNQNFQSIQQSQGIQKTNTKGFQQRNSHQSQQMQGNNNQQTSASQTTQIGAIQVPSSGEPYVYVHEDTPIEWNFNNHLQQDEQNLNSYNNANQAQQTPVQGTQNALSSSLNPPRFRTQNSKQQPSISPVTQNQQTQQFGSFQQNINQQHQQRVQATQTPFDNTQKSLQGASAQTAIVGSSFNIPNNTPGRTGLSNGNTNTNFQNKANPKIFQTSGKLNQQQPYVQQSRQQVSSQQQPYQQKSSQQPSFAQQPSQQPYNQQPSQQLLSQQLVQQLPSKQQPVQQQPSQQPYQQQPVKQQPSQRLYQQQPSQRPYKQQSSQQPSQQQPVQQQPVQQQPSQLPYQQQPVQQQPSQQPYQQKPATQQPSKQLYQQQPVQNQPSQQPYQQQPVQNQPSQQRYQQQPVQNQPSKQPYQQQPVQNQPSQQPYQQQPVQNQPSKQPYQQQPVQNQPSQQPYQQQPVQQQPSKQPYQQQPVQNQPSQQPYQQQPVQNQPSQQPYQQKPVQQQPVQQQAVKQQPSQQFYQQQPSQQPYQQTPVQPLKQPYQQQSMQQQPLQGNLVQKKQTQLVANCQDNDKNCKTWASYCKSGSNIYVMENCRQTCNLCHLPISSNLLRSSQPSPVVGNGNVNTNNAMQPVGPQPQYRMTGGKQPSPISPAIANTFRNIKQIQPIKNAPLKIQNQNTWQPIGSNRNSPQSPVPHPFLNPSLPINSGNGFASRQSNQFMATNQIRVQNPTAVNNYPIPYNTPTFNPGQPVAWNHIPSQQSVPNDPRLFQTGQINMNTHWSRTPNPLGPATGTTTPIAPTVPTAPAVTTVATTPNPNCIDRNGQCSQWTSFCHTKYVLDMCLKSCKKC